jgi:drug/metabolite transporter (DMT)-like permease
MKLFLFTLLALGGFAANSIICRIALNSGYIDALNFTWIRLLSAILVLVALVCLRGQGKKHEPVLQSLWFRGSWVGAISLFVYALFFSYAYISLDTGVGALVLFASVQLVIFVYGAYRGESLSLGGKLGAGLSFVGFVYLLGPSLSTPSVLGFVLMVFAGVAWAAYTIKGKGSKDAVVDTASNFLRTLPMLAVLIIPGLWSYSLTWTGAVLSITSGALASGLAYAAWYHVLPKLSTHQAGVLQLLVPIIAGIGGIIFMGERLSLHFSIAALVVLCGILILILSGRAKQQGKGTP